tara:strand:- start:3598 stop:3807 length:210 start_codon:yes stop_codon:yes gene_type:complete
MILVKANIKVEDRTGRVWGKYKERFSVKSMGEIDEVVDNKVNKIVAETARRESDLVVKVWIRCQDMPEA